MASLRFALLFLLLATPAWAQYPEESEPIRPPTTVLWVEVRPDVLVAEDPSQQIDVLFVIASSVTTSQATADTLCSQYITRGNEVLANDPANISRLHLVGCKLVNYTSTTSTNDLNAIANTSGVLYAQVNQWRNDLGADVVQMISSFTNSCGIAYQCAAVYGAKWAYGAVQNSCGISNYSGIHEMGHNVCLDHDAPNTTGPSFSYGLGFCDSAHGRRDPMVYPSPCGGSRVSYFGNPDISPFGYPFGNATNANNARVWREQAAAVAAFRPAVTPPTCPTITVTPSTLANGYTGRAYSQTFTASGGSAPYTFVKSSGTLPAGITFTTATLSGTTTVAGNYTFTIQATDATSCTGNTAYTLHILQLPTAPTNLTEFTPPQ